MSAKRILFVINVDWFFISHRLPIALAAIKNGYQVYLACTFTNKKKFIEGLGIVCVEIPISRSGRNVLIEGRTIFLLARAILKINPNIVHAITIKPVLYAGILCRVFRNTRFIASISGLGFVFRSDRKRTTIIQSMTSILYKIAFKPKDVIVIFQNNDDLKILIRVGAVLSSQAVIIKGSGVDLRQYNYTKEPIGLPIITFIGRLLLSKGVGVLVESAQILNSYGVNARIIIVGDIDPGNPDSVSGKLLEEWHCENNIQFLGFRTDINKIIEDSNIIVLPSYYGEGLPKTLIEAAACGRAVVTTNHPGCRDAIIDGETGLLVPVRDAQALANALKLLIESPELRKAMGLRGRALAVRDYNIENVIAIHLDLYCKVLNPKTKISDSNKRG